MTKNEEFKALATIFFAGLTTIKVIDKKQLGELSKLMAQLVVDSERRELNVYEYVDSK